MKRTLFFSSSMQTVLVAVLVMSFSACGSSEEYQWESWEENDSEFSVSVLAEDGTEESLKSGSSLGVYVVGSDGIVTWATSEVDKDGNVVLPPSALTGQAVVYTPVQPHWGADAYTSMPKFYVKSDQSTEANYDASDLMIGTAKSATRATSLTLSLQHMLAKVVIHVIDETGMHDFSSSSTMLLRMDNAVTVDLSRQSTGIVEKSVADIDMLKYNATDRRISMTAIVAPQTRLSGEEFFELIVPGSRHICTFPSTAELEAGKTFVFQMRYTESGPMVEGSYIAQWENDGSEAIFDIKTNR